MDYSSAPSRCNKPDVLVFNPLAEGYLAHGKAFTPIKHQGMLARDLANLPQFLGKPGDVVLVEQPPSTDFLEGLERAGFVAPDFVQLKSGRIDPESSLCRRELGNLRPWAWGPDSLELLAPLFRQSRGRRRAEECFNDNIARFYSKAWSADFLSRVLAECRVNQHYPWLCSDQEAGVTVRRFEDALEAITAIRRRGHHRVVVKEAYGLAGHNAIRLWEPELLLAQRQWSARAFEDSRELVVEPWLERELDYSIQLEMEPSGLRVCGYTGLLNDRKGQFLANWAEPGWSQHLPGPLFEFFPSIPDLPAHLGRVYGRAFSRLETDLREANFLGPVSIDAFVYRTCAGEARIKPVVEINPRYTMGRVTLELMKHAWPGTCGIFRLVNGAQVRAEGCADLRDYAAFLQKCAPLQVEGAPPKIRGGAICLNDPSQAEVCLATFEVRDTVPGNGLDWGGPKAKAQKQRSK